MTEEDHFDYMMKKSALTRSRWERIMQCTGRITDNSFIDSEELTPIEPNTESSENTKNTKNIPTTNQNIPNEQRIKEFFSEAFD